MDYDKVEALKKEMRSQVERIERLAGDTTSIIDEIKSLKKVDVQTNDNMLLIVSNAIEGTKEHILKWQSHLDALAEALANDIKKI